MIREMFSDQEILSLIEQGNEERALEHLYKTLLPKVKKLTNKYRVRDLDAYDVFQESILKFYDYVKRGKFDSKHAIGAFVLTIAKNKLIDLTRKMKARPEVEIEESYIEYSEKESNLVLIKEKRKSLETLFETIGERCKELLLLSLFDKRSMKDICHILGFSSENSAKTQNYKCKQKLIKSIEQNQQLVNEVLSYV